jgi:lipocalin
MEIDIKKYMGKWYEIARIHNEFEDNMTNVTAEYTLLDNGNVKIINSGFLNGELKQIIGHALRTDKNDIFRVSFYPHVYSNYHILAIDEFYQYALVAGNTKNYLWILARQPYITKSIFNQMLQIAQNNGFNINRIQITK